MGLFGLFGSDKSGGGEVELPTDVAIPVPFTCQLPDGLTSGQSVVVSGKTAIESQRFEINLLRGGDTLVHVSVRFNQNALVLNSHIGNQWGKEERDQNPFTTGGDFQVEISAQGDTFVISGNGQMLHEFKSRGTYENEQIYVTVKGDCQLTDVHWTGKSYGTPATSDFQNGHLEFGHRLFVQGTANGAFKMDLLAANGDILLHFNPRFDQEAVVRNSCQGGAWGQEERGGAMPFRAGQPFNITVANDPNGLQLFVNGDGLAVFKHRTADPANDYVGVRVEGEAEIATIHDWNPNQTTPKPSAPPPAPTPAAPITTPAADEPMDVLPPPPPMADDIPQDLPSEPEPPRDEPKEIPREEPREVPHDIPRDIPPVVPRHDDRPPVVRDPRAAVGGLSVPYTVALREGLHTGQSLYVRGRSHPDAQRIDINLMQACAGVSEALLQVAIRFGGENVLLLNSCFGGQWGQGERLPNPFRAGDDFDVEIRANGDRLTVTSAGRPLHEYMNRTPYEGKQLFFQVFGDCSLSAASGGAGDASQIRQVRAATIPVPFTVRLREPLATGQTVSVHGTANGQAQRIDINLMTAGAGVTDALLQVALRWGQEEALLLNSCFGGQWGQGERVQNPFRPGGDFHVEIRANGDRLTVTSNGSILHEYRCSAPYENRELFVQVFGDCQLSEVSAGGHSLA